MAPARNCRYRLASRTQGSSPRGLFFIGAAVALVGVTMAMQMGLNANFLSEDIGIDGRQIGMLEAARESCGILALAVLAVLAGFAEPLVGAAMLLLVGAGLGAYVFVHSFTWVLLMSLVWSQGLHVWMPLPNSMALALARPGRAGHRLGQIGAAGSAGFGLGLLAAFVLTKFHVAMRPMYVVAGATAVLAATACLGIHRNVKTPGPRLVFRRRYALFYLLSFLEGWRKQIFIAFAGFLLVERYETPLETILLLWLAIQAIGYVSAPRVGRLIDRVGERRMCEVGHRQPAAELLAPDQHAVLQLQAAEDHRVPVGLQPRGRVDQLVLVELVDDALR